MISNSKNIRGTTNSLLTITNDDTNASWLSVSADNVTANVAMYINGVDVQAEIDSKQPAVDTDTDLVVNSLDVDEDPAVITFGDSGEIRYTSASPLMTVNVNSLTQLSLSATTADFQDNAITTTGDITCNKINCTQIEDTSGLDLLINSQIIAEVNGTGLDMQTNNVSNCGNVAGNTGNFTVSVDTPLINSSADLDFTVTGELDLNADTIFVRSGAHMGLSVSPVSCFQVGGELEAETTLTVSGVHIGQAPTSNNYGINICNGISAASGDNPFIYFSEINSAYKGALIYDLPTNKLDITASGGLQLNGTDFGNLQSIYDLSTSSPQFQISQTNGALRVKGNSFVLNTLELESGSNTSTIFSVSSVGAVSCAQNITTSQAVHCNSILCTTNITCESLDVDTNVLKVDAVNNRVGINNGTPSVDLDITGAVNISGNLAVDTNTLYVDSTNNRVGVGLTNPQNAFHVNGEKSTGNSSVAGICMGTSSTTGDTSIELIANASTDLSFIDFTYPSSDYRGRIMYDLTNEKFDFSSNGAVQLILSNTRADFQDNEIKTTGNLTINKDKFSVNSTSGFVGIGTTTQEHSELLHVQGEICCDSLCVNGTSGVITSAQFTTSTTNLDLATSDAYNGDYTLRIWKTALGNARGAKLTTQGELELNGGTGDVHITGSDLIVESGQVVDANLNSTRGQLISFMGEENAALQTSSYDFNYGNGAVSGSSWGMMIPCKCKLKRFCYGATGVGTNYTTSTRIVFRLHLDGVAQSVYAYCDFSDTTNGSVSKRRFANKFSSSSTSQVDTEPEFTNTHGQSLAWETITLTAYNTDVNKHRFSVVVETTENL